MSLLLFCLYFLTFLTNSKTPTELFEAIRSDDVSKLKEALKSGLSINTIGPGGQTPLMAATLGGSVKCVKYLLKNNADPSIGEKDGYTPMHGAGFQGRAEIAKLLIEFGLNPRAKHSDGFEPIERACWGREQRHTDTVKVFLENGVPFNEQLIKAARNNKNTVKLLKKWKKQQKSDL